MNRKWKITIFIIASLILNLLSSLLFFDVLHIPLFFDTVFTVALVFYLGLIPGLLTGFLYNFVDTLFNMYVRGIVSPTNMWFSLCGAAIALVTWAFARNKAEFQISKTISILYLLLIALLSSLASILIGGIIDFVRFSYYDIPDSMAPVKQFTDSFLSQKFSLFTACILGQIPISLMDRIISTFAGYGVYKLCCRFFGPSEEL